jgi:hypothetical protein
LLIDLEGADLHSIELNPFLLVRSVVLLRRKDAYQTFAMRAFIWVLSGFLV